MALTLMRDLDGRQLRSNYRPDNSALPELLACESVGRRGAGARALTFHVEQHNTVVPHLAFAGQTPDERPCSGQAPFHMEVRYNARMDQSRPLCWRSARPASWAGRWGSCGWEAHAVAKLVLRLTSSSASRHPDNYLRVLGPNPGHPAHQGKQFDQS